MSAVEGWRSITFGEVCKFTGGNGFREELQGQKDGDYPFIKVSDMELPSNKKMIVEANNWIDEKTRRNDAFKAFPENSVVFAKVGAALLLNRRRILTRPTCIDNNMMAAVPHGIAPLFLFYLLEDLDFAIFVQSGAVPSINQAQLSCISFELPQSKPEQTKIAEILSTVDRAIEQTEALIAKQQRIKTGLMQDLLTRGIDEHGNLRSEQTHKFKDSSLGRIPVEWDVVQLDALATRGSGHTPNKRKAAYWNGGIKWVSLADSSKLDQVLITETDKKISALGIRYSSAVLHPKGTVVLSRDAGVGKSAILADDMAVSQHFMAWRCKPAKLDNYYLYYWLQRDKPKFEGIASGSTIVTIGLQFFREYVIAVPITVAEQTQISKTLSNADRALQRSSADLEKLMRLKTALMQDLLTGKKRVTALLKSAI
ncbi:MAG: restriction endonuclease subunit S [Thermodesulfovibrionales bacterium]